MSKHTPVPDDDEDMASAIGGFIDNLKSENATLKERNAELLEALKEIADTPAGSMANDSEALRHTHNLIVRIAIRAIAKEESNL